MGVTRGQTTETYYGPGGAKYQVVAKPEQTGNIHFAFEGTVTFVVPEKVEHH